MRYLLDTHTFLWWLSDDSRLSTRTRAIISDWEAEVWFSVASAWEIAIKAALGRISFHDDMEEFIPKQVGLSGFKMLSIEARHALRVSKLPQLHRDPFDRMLVAQALVEDMIILTADEAIARYGVSAW